MMLTSGPLNDSKDDDMKWTKAICFKELLYKL